MNQELARWTVSMVKTTFVGRTCQVHVCCAETHSWHFLTCGAIRDLFSKACQKTPSIVFIDHIEVIAGNFNLEIEKPLLNELMRCMDNPRNNKVLVIAATDIPQILDPAIKRRGRFEREIYIGLPDETARLKMLEIVIRGLINQAAGFVTDRMFDDRKLNYVDWRTKPFSEEEMKSYRITTLDLEMAVKQMQSSFPYLRFFNVFFCKGFLLAYIQLFHN
ncbi:hypothetical protein LXL04_022732 [Taraxacum kok-saghyz]